MRLRKLLVGGISVFGLLAVIALFVSTTYSPLNYTLRDSVPRPSDYVDARVLAANTAETVTVPTLDSSNSGTRIVVAFSSSCADYYVRHGGTATVASSDVIDGTGSQRNPAALSFAQGDTYSIIAPTTCIVTLAEYPS